MDFADVKYELLLIVAHVLMLYVVVYPLEPVQVYSLIVSEEYFVLN